MTKTDQRVYVKEIKSLIAKAQILYNDLHYWEDTPYASEDVVKAIELIDRAIACFEDAEGILSNN